MHSIDHDHREDTLRPKGAHADGQRDEQRPDTAPPDTALPDPVLFDAAAARRTDVLGARGLLRLQRAVGNAGTAMLADERSPVLDVVGRGGGQPLDADVRADMETRLGADFADVRIHTDAAASESAKAVGAHAYTVGSDVVFGQGRFDTSSVQGQTTLAHELTHVVQQRSGPVDGTATGDGVRVSDPGDRFERAAAENAERVMAQPAPGAAMGESGQMSQSAAPAVAQRESADDEDELQLLADPALQREADEEEDEEEKDDDEDEEEEDDDEKEFEELQELRDPAVQRHAQAGADPGTDSAELAADPAG